MAQPLREQFLEIMMEQVRACRYPSPGMLDRLEQAIGDRAGAEEYVSGLLERISAERYPSPQMLDRLSGLLDALDALDGRPA